MNNDRNVDGEAMFEVEGVDVTQMVGSARPTVEQFDEAFQRFRRAFNIACAEPGMKNFRAAVEASDLCLKLAGDL